MDLVRLPRAQYIWGAQNIPSPLVLMYGLSLTRLTKSSLLIVGHCESLNQVESW